jgi:hypothetical protein
LTFNFLRWNPLEQALVRLRIVRKGGHPWTSKEVEEKFRALGFEQIESYAPTPAFGLVARATTELP